MHEELRLVQAGKQLDQLTQVIHLVTFLKLKNFANPILSLQIYTHEHTTQETQKSLIEALMMAPKEENKNLRSDLSRLEQYTQIINIVPFQMYPNQEENREWRLIFDLFGLCKLMLHDLIPYITQLFTNSNPSIDDISELRKFLEIMGELNLLQKEIIEPMLPFLRYKLSTEKLESFLLHLHKNALLTPEVLKAVLPLLKMPYIDALNIFFTSYQEELKSEILCGPILGKLNAYCIASLPEKNSFDDVVPTNTPTSSCN